MGFSLLLGLVLFGQGQTGTPPLTDYLHWEHANPADYQRLPEMELFRGGLEGVKFNKRQLYGPMKLHLEPGLTLYPSDSTYQKLVVLWGYDFDYDDDCDGYLDSSPGVLGLLHGPAAQGQTQRQRPDRTVHVACIEMTKEMPQNMRFKVGPCPDPVLAKLCAIGKNAPIRGLYDQPRIWIYTDHATLEDCNAHLVRQLTPSIYLRALWEDSTVGAIDLDKKGFQQCVQPRLLEGLNAPLDAKVWLVQALDKVNPDGMVKELTDHADVYPPLLTRTTDLENMAALLDALAQSKTAAVTGALPAFVTAAIPGDKRDVVLGKCKRYGVKPS